MRNKELILFKIVSEPKVEGVLKTKIETFTFVGNGRTKAGSRYVWSLSGQSLGFKYQI